MKQVTTIHETRQLLDQFRKVQKTIGFVPTMGALHEGHLTLIRRAKQENDICICSVFVNPTQFNNRDDLEKYPRNLALDARMLESNGCDVLFAPEVTEMYPEGECELPGLDFGRLEKVMEGKFRPGHFRGVATVVHRLFDITTPGRAYFGKKDYQQLAIIRAMVSQMGLAVEIISCDTIREQDGLAMSSRNMRLSISERQTAPVLHQVLQAIREKAGTRSVNYLKAWGVRHIEKHPEFRVEYLEIADRDTLLPISSWKEKSVAVIFVAAFLGDVRLIDNVELFS